MAKAIGIDLGTTNSCVSIIEHGDPLVIPNDEGSRTTPSVIAFTDDGQRLVGHIARRQAVTNPTRTLYAIKRLIGRQYDSPEVEHTRNLAPYEIVEADNGDAWVQVEDKKYAPAQISAMVLEKMKEVGEAYIGEEVTNAIVTVPAYFDDSQRQATKDAGAIAGLNVLRIINEPTAAALAYGLDKQGQSRIAVFDLGGGTFDISILEMDNGVFVVKGTNGDTFLGGEDFDNRIIEHLLEVFVEDTGIDLRGDKVAMQRLKEAAEKAKHELSSTKETDINLPFITSGEAGPVHLVQTLTRHELEEVVSELITRLADPCERCLEDAKIAKDELDAVLLVGGMTRMPRVRERVREIFGIEPYTDLNPDEVVAIGAAVQCSVLSGDVKDVLLLDVTPLTLGIEIAGGLTEPIIKRNTTVPCRKSKIFTTALDNQEMVRVHILQGERDLADYNKSLGRLELHGVPPAPRGLPEIEVTFEIDANGIMNVKAKDLGTSKTQQSRIVAGGGLNQDEVEAMVAEAEEYRDQDQSRREVIEARNRLEGLIYSTQRSLEEFGDALDPEDQEIIQEALEAAREAMESDDAGIVLDAHEDLTMAAQRLAEAIYGGLRDEMGDGDDFDDFDDFDDDDDDDSFDDDSFDDDDDDDD